MKSTYATANYEDAEHYVDENGEVYFAEEWFEEDEGEWWEEESSLAPSDDVIYFEDKEYDEVEAVYVQAYNDVRRDLKSRRKERGFIKHQSGGKGGKSKGKGKGKRSGKGKSKSSRRLGSSSSGMIRGSDAELESRTRCWNCQELGHFERNCPLKQAGSKSKFVVVKGNATDAPASTTTKAPSRAFPAFRGFSSGFPNFRNFVPEVTETALERVSTQGAGARAIYAGVRCSGYEALVDTAAEDAVMGTHAYEAMCDELALHNLQPMQVSNQQRIPCTGIGGAARIRGIVDVPTSVAGLLGVIRFTIIEDEGSFATPPLLPISYLEAVGSVLDLRTNTYATQDGHTTQMRRLPSGHRAINLLDFATTQWRLPPEHRVRGRDPFKLLPGQSHRPLPPPSSHGSSHSFLGGVGAIGYGRGGGGDRERERGPSSASTSRAPSKAGEDERDGSRSRSRSEATVPYEDTDDSEPSVSPGLRAIREVEQEEGEEEVRPERSESELQEVLEVPTSPSPTESMRRFQQRFLEIEEAVEEVEEEHQEEDQEVDETEEQATQFRDLPPLPEHEPVETFGDGIYWRGHQVEPSTDGSSTPERAYPRYVTLTNLEGNLVTVSNNIEVNFYVKKVNGERRWLEVQLGWRNVLPKPYDLRRRPVETLDTRRTVEAEFLESQYRTFNDHWTANVRFQEPWGGSVIFYEAVPSDEPLNPKYVGPGIWGNYGPGRGGGGGGPSSSSGTRFHLQLPPRGRGGWSIPPRGRGGSHGGQSGKGKGASSSYHSKSVLKEGEKVSTGQVHKPEVVSGEAVRCEFFKIYDDDDMIVNEADGCDEFCILTEPKSVKTVDLRSWHGGFSGCLRRARVHDRSRSQQSQMLTALSRAASSFLTRWTSRHGEEEREGGIGQPAVQDLQVGGRGVGERPTSTSEDGFGENPESLASCGHGLCS